MPNGGSVLLSVCFFRRFSSRRGAILGRRAAKRAAKGTVEGTHVAEAALLRNLCVRQMLCRHEKLRGGLETVVVQKVQKRMPRERL